MTADPDSSEKDDRGAADAISVTISGADLEHARRMLARIVHAADRRAIRGGARELESEKDASEEDPYEALALQLFAIRQARNQFLARNVAGQAAWDILVTLYLTEKAGVRHNIGRMIELSGSALTTGLRYVDLLEAEGLAKRKPDPSDGRIFYLTLTRAGRALVEKILSAGLPH